MSVDWSAFLGTWGAALALYLVLEGILPFLSPQTLKRAMLSILQLQDRQLRTVGLFSMLAGLALLYFVHS
jgi:uncharacterized protein YjeT (DUF2065 family)